MGSTNKIYIVSFISTTKNKEIICTRRKKLNFVFLFPHNNFILSFQKSPDPPGFMRLYYTDAAMYWYYIKQKYRLHLKVRTRNREAIT